VGARVSNTTSPALGQTCAWCLSDDWERGELAVMPATRGALFHDRAGTVPVPLAFFDPAFFDTAFFDTITTPGTQNGRVPGPCYAAAVAARFA
jgi:hypothetical protein